MRVSISGRVCCAAVQFYVDPGLGVLVCHDFRCIGLGYF